MTDEILTGLLWEKGKPPWNLSGFASVVLKHLLQLSLDCCPASFADITVILQADPAAKTPKRVHKSDFEGICITPTNAQDVPPIRSPVL